MQDEIKAYKDEIKKQQLAEIQHHKQIKMKEKLIEERHEMEKEMQDQKLKMRNFKISKFVIFLNSMVVRQHRTLKYHSINQLQGHMLELHLKEKKLRGHSLFSTKLKILRQWSVHVRAKVQERKLEQQEKERLHRIQQENKADRCKYL